MLADVQTQTGVKRKRKPAPSLEANAVLQKRAALFREAVNRIED